MQPFINPHDFGFNKFWMVSGRLEELRDIIRELIAFAQKYLPKFDSECRGAIGYASGIVSSLRRDRNSVLAKVRERILEYEIILGIRPTDPLRLMTPGRRF